MVVFIFGDRDIQCAYFPNDRVLYDFRKKEIVIDSLGYRALEGRGLDTADIRQMLWHGKVDFERSLTEVDSCKEYFIQHSDWEARWQNCTHELRLLEVK
jgi:hypothetical protein